MKIDYVNRLPEEIIEKIYRLVFDSCLTELKNIVTCCMCDKIIYSENLFNESYSNCKNCSKEVCFECWKSYCRNYDRGWKPYLSHCKECAIYKFNKYRFNDVNYPY